MWSVDDIPDLTGKVAVVTGGNGGLGLASVKALAAKGARVVMAARNQAKAQGALDEVRLAVPNGVVEVVELDLGSLRSVDGAANQISDTHDRLDILMCNAGLMAMPPSTTEDGFEMQFGVNVLGHWALTARLLPRLVGTPGSRVVTLSSVAQHQGRAIDPDDPHLTSRGYDAWGQYGNTKLAARHFAVGLQAEYDRHRVDAKALSAQPGLTNSDLQATTADHGGAGFLGRASEVLAAKVGMSTDYGALSQLRAATDPKAPGGGFYGPLFAVAGPPVKKPLVRPGSDAAVDALWTTCTRETGIPMDIAGAVVNG